MSKERIMTNLLITLSDQRAGAPKPTVEVEPAPDTAQDRLTRRLRARDKAA